MKKYIESFVNYRFLLWELVKKGIKLKYRRSYLGIIWSLLEPLLTMIVLTIVFGTILGTRTKEFSVYILCGRLLYNFYSTSTKSALTSIRRNAAMIKKVYVPKYLYTLSSILYNYIFCANCIKEKFCPGCHPLGRCICQRYCLYRHVADGEKESGKLVLVDRYQYCFHSFVFC